MTLTLKYVRPARVPLEVQGVTPEVVALLSLSEIADLPVYHGNRQERLGDFFELQGDPSDDSMVWEGDLAGVHWIGAGMTRGSLLIRGEAGRHVGSEMQDGWIDVEGDVGDWVGAQMRGGRIRVSGDAADWAGGAYRGSARGMTGGVLLVQGNAGNEVGHSMRRGLLAVGGRIGDLAGFNLLAGSLLAFGDCGIRCGASMRRGTLALLGPGRPRMLPTFRPAGVADASVLRLLFRELQRHGFSIPDAILSSRVELFHGDLLEGGRGEVFVRDQAGVRRA